MPFGKIELQCEQRTMGCWISLIIVVLSGRLEAFQVREKIGEENTMNTIPAPNDE